MTLIASYPAIPQTTAECPVVSSEFVYLHGKAEDRVGFDIPYLLADTATLAEGVYPVVFNGDAGYTLYFWRRDRPRGLVVQNTDQEAVAYATRAMHERKPWL